MPGDARRMMRETGCIAVMVGRGAIADPFVFHRFAGGPAATRTEAAAFARRYLDALLANAKGRRPLGRFKQLLRFYEAGGLFDEGQRRAMLRAQEPEEIYSALTRACRSDRTAPHETPESMRGIGSASASSK